MLFAICRIKTGNTPPRSFVKTITGHCSDGSGFLAFLLQFKFMRMPFMRSPPLSFSMGSRTEGKNLVFLCVLTQISMKYGRFFSPVEVIVLKNVAISDRSLCSIQNIKPPNSLFSFIIHQGLLKFNVAQKIQV